MNKKAVLHLVYAALCLSLCIVLPFITANIPAIGQLLSPMHFPVLLCGLLCGWKYGLIVGMIAPILRSLLLQFPPMYPTAISMAVELAVYGLVAGMMYYTSKRKVWNIYASLITAMIMGRVAGGIATIILLNSEGQTYTLSAFYSAYILGTWPGMVAQIILIPIIVIVLKKAKLTD